MHHPFRKSYNPFRYIYASSWKTQNMLDLVISTKTVNTLLSRGSVLVTNRRCVVNQETAIQRKIDVPLPYIVRVLADSTVATPCGFSGASSESRRHSWGRRCRVSSDDTPVCLGCLPLRYRLTTPCSERTTKGTHEFEGLWQNNKLTRILDFLAETWVTYFGNNI